MQAFKKVLELSNSQAAWVQMAFYGGYFCMAILAVLFLRKYSYKTGVLIGLGLLKATANPYILFMGDAKTATQRLNLTQAFNPVGLLVGLLFVHYFVLGKLRSDEIENYVALGGTKQAIIRTSDLMVIRDPSVILGLVILAVFIFILVNKMP